MKAWSYSQELGFILTWSNPKTRRGSGIYKLGGVKPGYKAASRQICAQAVSDVRWVSDVRCVGRSNRVGLPDRYCTREPSRRSSCRTSVVSDVRNSSEFRNPSVTRGHRGVVAPGLRCRTSEMCRTSESWSFLHLLLLLDPLLRHDT